MGVVFLEENVESQCMVKTGFSEEKNGPMRVKMKGLADQLERVPHVIGVEYCCT